MPEIKDTHKLWFGYGVGAVFFVSCLMASAQGGISILLHTLLCLLGVTVGWTVGIVATPRDEDEKTKFSELTKGFLALGSGYGIAKLEEPIVAAATDTLRIDTATLVIRVALFTTCFLVGLLFTLVTRLYDKKARTLEHVETLLKRAEQMQQDLGKGIEAARSHPVGAPAHREP